MNAIFSKERTNTGRQLEFDLAKAMTIVLMVWTHVYESLSTGFEPSLSATNAYVRGSITGAVTFMFCMGLGISYTRHNNAEECRQRGIKLLTNGFVLLLFREIIPVLLRCWVFNSPESAIYLIFGLSCDILQFAGLALLLVGLLKELRISSKGMLLISIAMSLLGTFLEGVSTGCYPVDQVLGFFWGTYSESYFPLFNWFIFVAAGHWFGEKYQFLRDKGMFHTISLLVGALLCAAYIYVSFNVDQNIFKGLTSERYLAHRPFLDAIVCIPINVGQISLLYFLGMLIPKKAVPVIIHPSRHINQYYCLSWVIISLATFKFGPLSSDARVMVAWVCILAATIAGVVIYSRFLQQKTEAFFGKHRVFWSALVWAICIGSFVWVICNFDSYPNFLQ